jgi:hypothetical protein
MLGVLGVLGVLGALAVQLSGFQGAARASEPAHRGAPRRRLVRPARIDADHRYTLVRNQRLARLNLALQDR